MSNQGSAVLSVVRSSRFAELVHQAIYWNANLLRIDVAGTQRFVGRTPLCSLDVRSCYFRIEGNRASYARPFLRRREKIMRARERL